MQYRGQMVDGVPGEPAVTSKQHLALVMVSLSLSAVDKQSVNSQALFVLVEFQQSVMLMLPFAHLNI